MTTPAVVLPHYLALSALLQYPEQALIDSLPDLGAALAAEPVLLASVAPLLDYLSGGELLDLQQEYVATFDRNPSHSLHLFEHVHGESRDRGQAMVDLMEEYKRHGVQMQGDDLPDYVPLFLEFLALQGEQEAGRLLGEAIHVLAHVGRKLHEAASPYARLFDTLELLSAVAPQPLEVAPVRDMDEALETFGPGVDGAEPLLKGAGGGVQPINFYPAARRQSKTA